MLKKQTMIDRSDELKAVLPGLEKTNNSSGVLCHSPHYAAIGCDLRNLDFLKSVLQDHLDSENSSVAILFVAEVSTAYMDIPGSQAVLEWAATYDDARFCLLEQHLPDGPDHPFAQTMLKHFQKLRTPLHAIGTIDQMKDRFASAGWPSAGLDIRPLWDLWSDPKFLSAEQRRALDKIEPFDEWEEFALFGSHYFLMRATKPASTDQPDNPPKTSKPTQEPEKTPLVATPLPGPHSHRRFADLLPPPNTTQPTTPYAFPSLAKILNNATTTPESIGLHAGLGVKERETSTEIYTTSPTASPPGRIASPPLPTGLMCHTITPLSSPSDSDQSTSDCLLIGGRRSPSQASSECWLRHNNTWQPAATLPEGRYRHSAAYVCTSSGHWGVLVHGGKTSSGTVLSSSLFWTRETGRWQTIPCSSGEATNQPPARFGANLILNEGGCSGSVLGGIGGDGTIVREEWAWFLDENLSIEWKRSEYPCVELEGNEIHRFGAQTTMLGGDLAIVGGVIGKGMLGRENEVVDLLNDGRRYPIVGERPMLVGHSLHGSLVLGGGATCFSFGTYWSSACELQLEQDAETTTTRWHLAEDTGDASESETNHSPSKKGPTECSVRRVLLTPQGTFDKVLANSKPLVLLDLDLGPCTTKWTPEYLKETLGASRKIVVHASPSPKMDFRAKNFTYETKSLGDFLDAIAAGGTQYLRSLSAAEPSKAPADLSADFPEIAQDFSLPAELAQAAETAHSSPLRISGPVAMWLHYDVMGNVLCQVRGHKRLILFPPGDVTKLGFAPGASSSSLDVFTATVQDHPELADCHPFIANLGPGEVLYIPPMWAHAAVPTEAEPSVAVNVFFRNLDSGYAAGRDVYGNRDLAAYEKGRKDVGMIARAFKNVPDEVRRFYLERLGAELMELAREGGSGEAR